MQPDLRVFDVGTVPGGCVGGPSGLGHRNAVWGRGWVGQAVPDVSGARLHSCLSGDRTVGAAGHR